MDPVKFLVMEVRPLLQSVNIFVTLAADIDVNHVKINLQPHYFQVDFGLEVEKTFECCDFCIIPSSLSCVTRASHSISFRFSTDNIRQELGSSKLEIVQNNNEVCQINLSNDMLISRNNSYKLNCLNCKQMLCAQAVFTRILPLPEGSSPSEWFCHAHDQHVPSFIPKLNEAFSKHTSIILNESLLQGVKECGTNLICKRCLAWIGTTSKSSHKVWLNTVAFQGESACIQSCALLDSFQVIRQVLANSLTGSAKVVLRCEGGLILLWILEKQLVVHFGTTKSEVCKVLFKFFGKQNDVADHWLSDVSNTVVDISKPMMQKVLVHLHEMNRYIPRDFRVSNGFYISYMMIYNESKNK